MTINRYNLFTLLIINIIFQSCGTAQSISDDSYRLNRDIRIMEGILDKLIDEQTLYQPRMNETKGIYLPDYGIIFYMKKTRPEQDYVWQMFQSGFQQLQEQQIKMNEKMAQIYNDHQRLRNSAFKLADTLQRSVVDEMNSREMYKTSAFTQDYFNQLKEKRIQDEQKAIDDMKSNLLEFFQQYAPAAGQLRPHERIGVLINLEGWESPNSTNPFLTSWISRQDAEKLRTHTEDESNLNDKVHFHMSDTENQIHKDVQIMSNILNEAMHTSPNRWLSSTSGIYLDGLGALFFIEMDGFLFDSRDTSLAFRIHKNIENSIQYTYGYRSEDKTADDQNGSNESILPVLQEELLDIIATYGHSIRLKPEEKVIVDVDMHPTYRFILFENAKPSHLTLQLKKKEIDNYHKKKMSLKSLKKKCVINTH